MTDEVINGGSNRHFSRTKWGGKWKLNESSKYRGAEEGLKQALSEWQIIFDSSKDLIMFVDVEFRIIRANLATSLFLGKDLNGIFGKTCFKLIHGSDMPPDICPLKKAKKTRKHEEVEFYLAERNMWLLVTVDPLLDHKGNMTGAVHIIKDITERKKVEKKVRLQSEIMMNMDEGANFARADDLVIVYTNPKFEKMFGYDSGELIGKHISVLNAPFERDPGEIAREIVEGVEEKGAWKGEVRNIKKNGTIFWSLANISIFNHPDYGRVFVSVQTDITERKKVEKEKDMLLKAIETAKEAISITDADGKMIYTNDAMDELFGYKKGELIGKSPSILKAGPNPKAITKQIMDAIEKQDFWEGEIHKKRKDGTEFISYARIGSVKDKHGRIIDFVSTQHDITKHKKAEEALKRSEKRLNIIFDSVPAMIWNKDKGGKYLQVNRAYCQAVGLSKEKVIGKTDYGLYPKNIANQYHKYDQKVFDSGEPEIGIVERHVRPSGEFGWCQTNKARYYDAEGNIVGTIGFAIDITDRKKAEQKLTDAYRKLKETQEELIQSGKMAAMGQLASGISHELNQPLTGIKGFAQTILMDIEEDNPVRKDVEKIIEQTDRMDRIIKNIRFFARRSEFKMEGLDINQPIEDSLMLLKEQLRIHSIHLKKSLGEGLPKIKGDSNQLQQVFLNMITNSRDAIDNLKDPNGGKLIVKTALSKNKKNIEIIFQDTGCGISKEDLDSIFNPFYTTKSPDGGIGLGLSIAYRIIENHKGKIEVESKKGKGATFKIILPIL